MPKYVSDTVLDAAFGIVDNAVRLTVTTQVPVGTGGADPTVAQINTNRLAEKTGLTAASFTLADGTTAGGRQVTVAAQSSLSITGTGTQTANNICLDDGTKLLYATTCSPQALTNGNTVNVPAWKIEISDPV